MKLLIKEINELIPDLNWPAKELADKLSAIGHETGLIDDNTVDVNLTANRKDCKDLKYLAFDLAAIYSLKTKENLIKYNSVTKINVTLKFVNKLLGTEYSEDNYKQLERLGFIVSDDSVTAPDFRTDIATSADIAEELIRLMGYKTLEPKMLSEEPSPESSEFDKIIKIKYALVAAGLTETMTISFAETGKEELRNPFSNDEKFLRPSLEFGLVKTLAKNPYLKRAAFFEVGDVFLPEENNYLGIILAGYKNVDQWAEKIEKAIGHKLELIPVDQKFAEKYDAKQSKIFFAEISVDQLEPTSAVTPNVITSPVKNMKLISKYPPLSRDITITNSSDAAENITNKLVGEFNNLLIAELIDEYHDEQSGKKSLTFRLIFQKMENSFTQEDIDIIDKKLELYTN